MVFLPLTISQLGFPAPWRRVDGSARSRGMRRAGLLLLLYAISVSPAAMAQTRTVRDTATAYGARLNAKGEPADQNPLRVNSRLDTRINGRLDLRIARYRVGNAANPTAAYDVVQDDKSRQTPLGLVPGTSLPAPSPDSQQQSPPPEEDDARPGSRP